MSRVVWVLIGGLCVSSLAACSSVEAPAAESTRGLSASASTAPSVSSANHTPSSDAQDMTDPDLGIVFADVPVLRGDEADVYNVIATYEKEYWRTMTTNDVSPAFSVIGSAAVQTLMSGIVDENVAVQADIGGTFQARVSDVAVSGDTAVGRACDDYAAATFTDADGPDTPAEAGFGETRLKEMTLSRVAAERRWVVETVKVLGPC